MARAIDCGELEKRIYSLARLARSDAQKSLLGRVLYIVENMPTLTPPNEPLTIEQLREMDGEPVWAVLIDEKYKYLDGWYLVHRGSAYLARIDDWELDAEEYGVEWLAYRRPPEGEEDT